MDLAVIPAAPSYLATANALASLDEFLTGLPSGGNFPPRIGVDGTRFKVHAPDKDPALLNVLEINVIILRAKTTMNRTFYLTKYDPNSGEDTKPPDCFSRDNVKPDPSSPNPQCENCAGCPHNVFGTAKDANGKPGKGKACSETKSLAVYYKNDDLQNLMEIKDPIYEMRISPASLSAFGVYVQSLAKRGVAPNHVVTTIGFDPKASFPKSAFKFAKWLEPAHLDAVAKMREHEQTLAICETKAGAAPAPVVPSAPAAQPVAAPVQAPEVDLGLPDSTPAHKEAKAPRAKKAEPAVAPVEPVIQAAPVTSSVPSAPSFPSDDDLLSSLGL